MSHAISSSSLQADEDSVFLQSLDGQLITGLPDAGGSEFVLQRVFSSQFPSTFAWNGPGFHSLSRAPEGVEAIPETADVAFDFLPMNIDGLTSNLLYWDGVGSASEDVQFGLPPDDGYTLTLFGRNNQPGTVAATAEMIGGPVLGRTLDGAGLRMHEHRFFFLDDGDEFVDPEEGVYLTAMQLRMDGLRATEPFFLVWGTLNTPIAAVESAARPWIESRVDQLILDGDYNFDGVVDTADFDVWTAQQGYSGPFPLDGNYADGNRDGVVDEADLSIWQANTQQLGCDPNSLGDVDGNGSVEFADFLVLSTNFGQVAATHADGDIDCDGIVAFADFLVLSANFGQVVGATQGVPEPNGSVLMIMAVSGVMLGRRRRS